MVGVLRIIKDWWYMLGDNYAINLLCELELILLLFLDPNFYSLPMRRVEKMMTGIHSGLGIL